MRYTLSGLSLVRLTITLCGGRAYYLPNESCRQIEKIGGANDRREIAELLGRGDPVHEVSVAARTIGMSQTAGRMINPMSLSKHLFRHP